VKLERIDGKRTLVLTDSEVSVLTKAQETLSDVSLQLGMFGQKSDATTADAAADWIRRLTVGEITSVSRPKKREKKPDGEAPTANGEQDAPADEPDPFAGHRCSQCREPLTKGEQRAKRTMCHRCDPIKEGAA
jgi:hypothetical protein